MNISIIIIGVGIAVLLADVAFGGWLLWRTHQLSSREMRESGRAPRRMLYKRFHPSLSGMTRLWSVILLVGIGLVAIGIAALPTGK